jgi:hypothetical protein
MSFVRFDIARHCSVQFFLATYKPLLTEADEEDDEEEETEEEEEEEEDEEEEKIEGEFAIGDNVFWELALPAGQGTIKYRGTVTGAVADELTYFVRDRDTGKVLNDGSGIHGYMLEKEPTNDDERKRKVCTTASEMERVQKRIRADQEEFEVLEQRLRGEVADEEPVRE